MDLETLAHLGTKLALHLKADHRLKPSLGPAAYPGFKQVLFPTGLFTSQPGVRLSIKTSTQPMLKLRPKLVECPLNFCVSSQPSHVTAHPVPVLCQKPEGHLETFVKCPCCLLSGVE